MSRMFAWLGFIAAMTVAPTAAAGSFAPAAGQVGSTAISMNDDCFTAWASGYVNYLVGADCDPRWQTPAKALGKAVGDSYDIVCLGNGGQITLTFNRAIRNGAGWDFAVFENSFNDTFLELAYVEVSSNGMDYFRFPNRSLTASAVGAFGAVDPTNIDGLAGKYRQGYGTPFDLEQLAGVSSLLDVNNILFVRFVDIVGDGTYFDTVGNVIYDPHKTTGSGGFDLDAVGVIHAIPEPGMLILLATTVIVVVVLYGKQLGPLVRRPVDPRPRPATTVVHARRRGMTAAWPTMAALLLALGMMAGTTSAAFVDFEDLTPTTDFTVGGVTYGQYWNGADRSGGFTSGCAVFNNHNAGWWCGFAYANVNYTDTSVSNYTHQYAAAAGPGFGGSGNYAIAYGYGDIALWGGALPTVTIPENMRFESMLVTNTTYAAASMLHGDSFSSGIGSDGWFLLTVTGMDAANNVSGVVEFYLAHNGNVLLEWTSVDLTALGAATSLTFDFSGSDSGEWGLNTPAYCAIDNIVLSVVPEPSMLVLMFAAGLALLKRRCLGR